MRELLIAWATSLVVTVGVFVGATSLIRASADVALVLSFIAGTLAVLALARRFRGGSVDSGRLSRPQQLLSAVIVLTLSIVASNASVLGSTRVPTALLIIYPLYFGAMILVHRDMFRPPARRVPRHPPVVG